MTVFDDVYIILYCHSHILISDKFRFDSHPRHVALFREEFEDTSRRFLNQFQATCVVSEGDVRKLDLFHAILE